MNEQELLQLLLTGDGPAFKYFVDTYKKMVFNTVLGFVQDMDDADDVTQEVFVKVYEHIGRFKQQSKLSTWVYRISVTQSLDFIRSRNRKRRYGLIMGRIGGVPLPEPADFNHPGIIAEDKERSAILFKAINCLTDKKQPFCSKKCRIATSNG